MKIFSFALRRQLKDCILAIFWPKKSIYEFFKECSTPASVLKRIERWDEQGLSRATMVDIAFEELAKRPDNGTLQFDCMLENLATWASFDGYWFTGDPKLDADVAQKKVAALKEAKTNNIDAVRKLAEAQRRKGVEQQERHKSLEDMREEFNTISRGSGTAQARGYAFERFLGRMGRFFDLHVTGPFRITGTQIDGTIKYDGENYNVEAKWEQQWMSDEPLLAFCRKLEINMHGRGIFISINGFSPDALRILQRAGMKNAILMDGEDIVLILNELTTLPDTLNVKIHAAQTRGDFFINPVTGKNKIPGS